VFRSQVASKSYIIAIVLSIVITKRDSQKIIIIIIEQN